MLMMLFLAAHINGFSSAQDIIERQINGYGWNLTTSAIKYDEETNEVDLYFYRPLPKGGYDSKTIVLKNIYNEDILVSSITNNASNKILRLKSNTKPIIIEMRSDK